MTSSRARHSAPSTAAATDHESSTVPRRNNLGVSKQAHSNRLQLSPERVRRLQRSVGNQALLRVLGQREGGEPPVQRAFARGPAVTPRAVDEALHTADSGHPPIIQRIPLFEDWKMIPSNARKDIGDWIQEAIAEFKDLYYQATDEKLTNDTKPPDWLKPIVMRFVKNMPKAKTNDAGAIQAIPEIVSEMRSAVANRPLADSRRATRGSELPILTEEKSGIANHILEFLPITSLFKVRATSRHLRFLADTTIVFRMRVPDNPGILTIRLQDVNKMMGDTTYAGLHGSSAADSKGLYSGITDRPAEEDRVYKTSQLGPGFYLTQGRGGPERRYAKSVAEERSKKTKTETRVFRVFLNLTKQVLYEVPQDEWADMEHDRVPPRLKALCQEPKLLTSAIVKNEPTRQIKVNPALFELVRVLPPQEAMDTDFVAWLTSYLTNHLFEFGEIVYDT